VSSNEQLPPVKEYVFIEAWQYESGDMGWKILPQLNGGFDSEILERLLFEMIEDRLEKTHESSVILTNVFLKDNALVRYSLKHDFSSRKNFVWLKKRFFDSEWRARGIRLRGKRLRTFWWSLEWLWYYVTGQLRASRKVSAVAGAPVPAPAVDHASEPSEGLESVSPTTPKGPAKVLPFRSPEC
jgi:hypothetical protein